MKCGGLLGCGRYARSVRREPDVVDRPSTTFVFLRLGRQIASNRHNSSDLSIQTARLQECSDQVKFRAKIVGWLLNSADERRSLRDRCNHPISQSGIAPSSLGDHDVVELAASSGCKVCLGHCRRKKTMALRPIDLELRTLLAAAISDLKLANSPKLASTDATASGPSAAPLFPLADTFKLHSLPGASKTIYLDFNGQSVTGTAWNSNGTR